MTAALPALEAPFEPDAIAAERERLAAEAGLPTTRMGPHAVELMLIPAGAGPQGTLEEDLALVRPLRPDWWSDEDTDRHLRHERPVHQVVISRPFYLAATETTIAQFAAFVDATGYRTLAERDGDGGVYYEHGRHQDPSITWRDPKPGVAFEATAPVTQVAHEDALAFCAWYGEQIGARCRLPSEAEWEWAARAGTTTLWHSGNDPTTYDTVAHRGPVPTTVATHAPNPFGLFDVYGNVWEWCADDWDHEAYLARGERAIDPRHTSDYPYRPRRGGAYQTSLLESRSAYRKGSPIAYRGLHVGFRVLVEITDDNEPSASSP